jgi:riboflavin biosynthesis pyrimidine reductase
VILKEVYPNLGASHLVSKEFTNPLEEFYPRLHGFRLNYVLSPEASEATSDFSTNALDRIILKLIRSQSDLIITTGKTVRSEKLNASSYSPMLILTRSDEPLEIPAVNLQSEQKVYLTQRLGMIYPNSNALAIGTFQNEAPTFCAEFCRVNRFESVVLETGISTSKDFSKAGLVHEVDLTVTRVSSQETAEKVAVDFLANLQIDNHSLVHLLNHEDSWFFRFGVR